MKVILGFIGLVCFCLVSCNSKNTTVSPLKPLKEGLIITEVMASNDSLKFGSNDLTPDWIEVFNSSDSSLDLSEFYLTDNSENPLKSQLSGQLLPDSYAVFYASGIDTLKNHLSFKLNNSGENLALYFENKALADEVTFTALPKNISYSLMNEGWFYSKNWSPGLPNNTEKVYTSLSEDVLVVYKESENGVEASFTSNSADEFKYKLLKKSEPVPEYQNYKAPISVAPGEVIKVKAVGKSVLKHKAHFSSYVPVNQHELPVVSLVTNPKNLWDDVDGLYTEKNCGFKEKKWQRTALVSFYGEDSVTNHSVDFKIFGNASRTLPKKSISVKSKTKFENILFGKSQVEFIDGFIVRACHTGMTMYRNEFINDLNESINGHLRMQQYVPAVLYLNGEYWGVYNILERKNDAFIKNHIGQKATVMVNINDRQVKPAKGDQRILIEELEKLNEISDPTKIYAQAESIFRMDELMDFWAHELFVGRVDSYNNRFWKSDLAEDKRWGVITFDYDIILGKAHASKVFDKYLFSEPNEGLKFFNTLIRSSEFKEKFVYRMCELMNTAYIANRSDEILDKYEVLTHKEFLADTARWNAENERSRISQVHHVKKQYTRFFKDRKEFIFDSIFPRIGFSKVVRLNVPTDFPGKVFVNGLEAGNEIRFFSGMDFKVNVKPDSGVKFLGWTNGKSVVSSEDLHLSKAINLDLTYELLSN